MIVDPVFIAAKAVALVYDRRMLVGRTRQFVEPAAGEFAESAEMRLKVAEILGREIKPQQVAQAAIDGVEILAGTVEPEMVRALFDGGRFRSVRRVHA